MKKRLISPAALALAVVAGVGGGALPAATASASGNTLNCMADDGGQHPSGREFRRFRLHPRKTRAGP